MTEASELIKSQRLPSAAHPGTWTEEDEFDRQLWTWHDGHHEPVKYGVCPTCIAEWEAFQAEEQAERLAVYDLAKELGL